MILVYAADHEPHARPQPDQPGETPAGALPVHLEDRRHIEFLSGADLIVRRAVRRRGIRAENRGLAQPGHLCGRRRAGSA